MSTNAFVSCPACKFLVATDDAICKWCNADLVALRLEQTMLRPPPPGSQPLEAMLKGRKARKLIPPTPIFATPPAPPASESQAVGTPPPPPPLGRPANAPPAPPPTVSPLPIAAPISVVASGPPPVGRAAVLAAPLPTVAPSSTAPPSLVGATAIAPAAPAPVAPAPARPTSTTPTSPVPTLTAPSKAAAPPPAAPWARPLDEPAAPPDRKRPWPAIAGAIALVVVLAGASWVALGRGHNKPAPTTVASTVPATAAPTTLAPTTAAPTTVADPLASWVPYSAPDGSFSMKFPQTPAIETQSVMVGTVSVPLTVYGTDTAGFMMMHFAVPIPADQTDAALNGGYTSFKAGVVAKGGTVSDPTSTTVLGRKALQSVATTPGEPTTYYTMILGSQDLAIVVSTGDLSVHQAMVASLQLNNV